MSDGRSGVANIGRTGRYATALPSALANAASWDLQAAYDFGALLGKEIRDLGFNVSLGGTANIIREPRNGRNFECLGEDPLLIGKLLGAELRGTQAQGVIGNINSYAVNDQETGSLTMNVNIDKRAMQETDLLANRYWFFGFSDHLRLPGNCHINLAASGKSRQNQRRFTCNVSCFSKPA